jgi:hypothetical protein
VIICGSTGSDFEAKEMVVREINNTLYNTFRRVSIRGSIKEIPRDLGVDIYVRTLSTLRGKGELREGT